MVTAMETTAQVGGDYAAFLASKSQTEPPKPTMFSDEDAWVAWHVWECRNDDPETRGHALRAAANVTLYAARVERGMCERYGPDWLVIVSIHRDVRVARRLNHLSLAAFREVTP